MTLPKEIFIVDEQLKSDIRGNPHFENLPQDFTIVDIAELANAETNLQVESDNSLVPLKDYKNKGHLVQSELYKNRYYTPFEYQNKAHEELAALMALLCNFMGNNKFDFEFYEIKQDSSEKKESIEIEVEGSYKLIDGKARAEMSDLQKENDEKGEWVKVSTEVGGAKKTPQELREYIEREGININALPATFRTLVKTYLDSENAKPKSYEMQVDTIKNANKYTKMCKNFSASVGAQIFKIKLGVDINSESSCLHKVRTKIRYSVTFN